jgi:hypothetical protein
MKSGKQNLQKIFTDLCDRPFGRQIRAIDIIDATDLLVGNKDLRDELCDAVLHSQRAVA